MKKHEAFTDNHSSRIYVNQKENKITSRIKAGYYLALLTNETMKLLGRTKSNLTKDKQVIRCGEGQRF